MKNEKVIPKPPQTKKSVPEPPLSKSTNNHSLVYMKNKEAIENAFNFLKSNLPNAIDLEELVLGALIIEKKAINEIRNILEPWMFYYQSNRLIYDTIISMYDSNKPVDLVTLSIELKRLNRLEIVGGDYYLISLTQRVVSSAHIEFHSRIIVQQYVLRALSIYYIHCIKKINDNDPDVFDLLDSLTQKANELYSNAIKINPTTIISNAKDELIELVRKSREGIPVGFPSGIMEFDNWCKGFRGRELITIAGRPGMGKTSFVLAMLRKACLDNNYSALFFSLEMSLSDVKQKLAPYAVNIPYTDIRNGKLTDEQLQKVLAYYDFIDKSNLYIVDKMNVYENIVAKIKDMHKTHNLKIVVIDYVQLMKMSVRMDKRLEVMDITRGLKQLAIELDLPILILAQLSRLVDNRQNKRPFLGDLKESGSIEEDSDTVGFIYRDAYYQLQDKIPIPPHMIGMTELIIAKGRNIGTGVFDYNFDPVYLNF